MLMNISFGRYYPSSPQSPLNTHSFSPYPLINLQCNSPFSRPSTRWPALPNKHHCPDAPHLRALTEWELRNVLLGIPMNNLSSPLGQTNSIVMLQHFPDVSLKSVSWKNGPSLFWPCSTHPKSRLSYQDFNHLFYSLFQLTLVNPHFCA